MTYFNRREETMRLQWILGLLLIILISVGISFAGTKAEDLAEIQAAIRAQGATWVAASNPIWEMSKEEQRDLCGLILEPVNDADRVWPNISGGNEVDEALDWRDHNGGDYVTDIRNQAQCGSCWAFGALGAMESRTLILANMPGYPLDLSEQFLVSCSNGSCNGYSLQGTCSFLLSDGTINESCFPYAATDRLPCGSQCSDWQNQVRRISTWNWIGSNEQAIKQELQNGPVYAGFTVYEDFNAYGNGVYYHVWGSAVGGHAIAIVGYDDAANCWICKNSWGANWGEDGYFRIRKGTNECGMEEWTCTLTPMQTAFSYLDLRGETITEEIGDGDGVLNPGETAELTLSVCNGPLCQSATNVQGELTSSDSRVEILNASGSFGTIAGGQTVQNSDDPFRIRVAEDATLSPIEFTIHLTASGGYAVEKELTIELTLDQAGFPAEVLMGIESSPIAFDIDGDNSQEILAGGNDGKLYMWESSGELASGFPLQCGNRIVSSPAVGDVDGNGTQDIAFASWDYHMYFLDASGNELVDPVDLGCFVSATPALGDLDGEPGLEAVVSCFAGKVWAVKGDGSILDGFPVQLPSQPVITNGAALADLDGDTRPEIIVGTHSGIVYALQADGSIYWETTVGSGVRSDITVADLTGSGQKILVGTMDGDLVILNPDGSEWNRYNLGSAIRTSPVPSNLDADPDLEIVVVTLAGQLYVLNPDGSNCDNFPVPLGFGVVSSPAISDIDNDGSPDMTFGDMYFHLHAVNMSGDELPNFPITLSGAMFSSPMVADIDGDNDLDIIIGTSTSLAVIDYKAESRANNFWNMFRGNPQRTANYASGFYSDVEQPPADAGQLMPLEFSLSPNYPNPFNPSTTLSFSLNQPASVTLTIWNVLGQKVATVLDARQDAGWHRIRFDASSLGSGVYFARLQVQNRTQIQKMVLVR
jgi:outer membrane protein assembly factor BamB